MLWGAEHQPISSNFTDIEFFSSSLENDGKQVFDCWPKIMWFLNLEERNAYLLTNALVLLLMHIYIRIEVVLIQKTPNKLQKCSHFCELLLLLSSSSAAASVWVEVLINQSFVFKYIFWKEERAAAEKFAFLWKRTFQVLLERCSVHFPRHNDAQSFFYCNVLDDTTVSTMFTCGLMLQPRRGSHLSNGSPLRS